jgi:hypothetical protein
MLMIWPLAGHFVFSQVVTTSQLAFFYRNIGHRFIAFSQFDLNLFLMVCFPALMRKNDESGLSI